MEELSKLIEEYGVYKVQEAEVKKEVDCRNKKIKTIMGQNNIDEYSSDNYTAFYTLRKSKDSLDEDKLLALFDELKLADSMKALGVIKTREYIDSEALESAMYKGDISDELKVKMQSCRVVKRTPTLTIKAKKEDK